MPDSITGAAKKLMSNKERAKRLSKSDRIKREKKGKPFSGNKKALELLGAVTGAGTPKPPKSVQKELAFQKRAEKANKKGKITKEQEKKFKSLFFVK